MIKDLFYITSGGMIIISFSLMIFSGNTILVFLGIFFGLVFFHGKFMARFWINVLKSHDRIMKSVGICNEE